MCASVEIEVPQGSAGDCAATFARLADVLAEPIWRNADVRVVVADCWARYCIVPTPSARLDSAGRHAHARYLLTDTFGESLADWSVELQDVAPGRACIACALPVSLRPTLDAVLAGAQLRLTSLQPQLIVAFNARRDCLPRDNAWFVTLEEGWLAAIHLAGGAWDRIHMARLGEDSLLELERLQAFGRLTRAADGAVRLFIEAAPWLRERLEPVPVDFEWLDAASVVGGPPHELELLLRARA
jgi:hypothetical protein